MHQYKFNFDNPRCYEKIEDQNEKITCTVWCVHMRLSPAAPNVKFVAKMETQDYVLCHYAGGGSWKQWGETEPEGLDDRHLVLYFRSVPNHAYKRAQVIVADHYPYVYQHQFVVSTSGDWAEQIQEDDLFI